MINQDLINNAAFSGGGPNAAHNRYSVLNPSTGDIVGHVPRCSEADVELAIEAASKAFYVWRNTTAARRSQVLRQWHDLVIQHRQDLAEIITTEEGKPLSEGLAEIDYAASFIQWFSEEAKRTCGDEIPAPRERTRIIVVKEPVGVCAAITPWNFPAAMVTRKAAPAIAAGCTMIVKPAPQTPFTALALAELARRAGVPTGVFTVVTGDYGDAEHIARSMTRSTVVRKITFTGSTGVGRLLLAQSAATVKRVSLELGGNAPFIVFDDANLDWAVDQLMMAKFRNSGQSCIGANRVFVQRRVYEAFVERFTARVCALRVGDGFEPGIDVGPLINEAAVRKVETHIADALAKGARLLCGGQRHPKGGNFFQPTVLREVRADMVVASEETFGPVAPMFTFDTDEDVYMLANSTEFGLAAYVFSESANRIWECARRLETGMLGVNSGFISNEVAPFGGVKQSGLGREGSFVGIEEFLESKYLCWAQTPTLSRDGSVR